MANKPKSNCCDLYCILSGICSCCFITIPFIVCMFLIAAIMLMGGRDKKIEKFNAAVNAYDNTHFKGLSFEINGVKTELMSENSFPNYPTHDACAQAEDPKEGCHNGPSFVHYASVPITGSTITMKVVNAKTQAVIESLEVEKKDTQILDKSALDCSGDADCYSKCSDKGGEWNSARMECSIEGYFNKACLRVKADTDDVVVDKDGELLVNTKSFEGTGCDYNNKMQTVYRNRFVSDKVEFYIRDYRDPYILAQDLLLGCPSKDDTSDDLVCFGLPKKQINQLVSFVLIPLVVYSLCTIFLSWGLFVCIRNCVNAGKNQEVQQPLMH